MVGRDIVDRAKSLAHRSTGINPDHILIAATHTHAAPAVTGIHDAEIDQWYAPFVATRIADGITRANGNLQPAEIGSAFVNVPQHVHNRRWFMKPGTMPENPFGDRNDQVKMNPPRNSENLVRPAGPVDPQLSVVSIRSATDNHPIALLANYSLHYVGGYESGHISSDYFGVFCNRIARELGGLSDPPFVAALSNGTSGDINNIDFRSPRQKNPPWQQMRIVADDLATKTIAAIEGITYDPKPGIDVATTELMLGVRRPDEPRLQWARQVFETIEDQPKRLTRPQIYATEALKLADYPERVPVFLQSLRIGELAIAAIPCEVFAETGLAIKERSPFPSTFTIELAGDTTDTYRRPSSTNWEATKLGRQDRRTCRRTPITNSFRNDQFVERSCSRVKASRLWL